MAPEYTFVALRSFVPSRVCWDFAGRIHGLDFSVVVAVPIILYLVRFSSSKSCN